MSRRTMILSVLSAAMIVAAGAPAAQADDHSWTSLYDGTQYAGAGWSRCPDPIRVSVDTRALDADQRSKAWKALKLAIGTWDSSKVVSFAYGGEVPVTFDRATGVSTPEDGVARDRWIYITLVKAKKQKATDTAVVGLAGPLRIDPATNIITEGSAAFLASYVNRQSRALVAELFAHEIGHVAGLGHSTSKKDVMYPILTGHTKLGAGDIAGAWALLKPCPTAPAEQPAGG